MNDASATQTSGGGVERARFEVTHVGSFHHRHSRVLPQRPGELPAADVDRNDVTGATLEEAVGESTGGCPDVDAVSVASVDGERVERGGEFHPASGHVRRRRTGNGDRLVGAHLTGGAGGRGAGDEDTALPDGVGRAGPARREASPDELRVEPPPHCGAQPDFLAADVLAPDFFAALFFAVLFFAVLFFAALFFAVLFFAVGRFFAAVFFAARFLVAAFFFAAPFFAAVPDVRVPAVPLAERTPRRAPALVARDPLTLVLSLCSRRRTSPCVASPIAASCRCTSMRTMPRKSSLRRRLIATMSSTAPATWSRASCPWFTRSDANGTSLRSAQFGELHAGLEITLPVRSSRHRFSSRSAPKPTAPSLRRLGVFHGHSDS